MLTCSPRSLFSGNFSVAGSASGPGTVEFNWWSEQGAVTLGPNRYDIVKHGVFSGRWTMEQAGVVLADAHKPSAMMRTFEVRYDESLLTVEAQSMFGRSFNLLKQGHIVGTISPAHPFTRRSTINAAGLPDPILLLSFWLVALTWRRANQSAAASNS